MRGDVDSSLDGIEAIFLDLDGTIYLGGDSVSYTHLTMPTIYSV